MNLEKIYGEPVVRDSSWSNDMWKEFLMLIYSLYWEEVYSANDVIVYVNSNYFKEINSLKEDINNRKKTLH